MISNIKNILLFMTAVGAVNWTCPQCTLIVDPSMPSTPVKRLLAETQCPMCEAQRPSQPSQASRGKALFSSGCGAGAGHSAQPAPPVVTWEYEEPANSNSYFAVDGSVELEAAYHAHCAAQPSDRRTFDYTTHTDRGPRSLRVDFGTMTQTSLNSGYVRRLRRTLQAANIDTRMGCGMGRGNPGMSMYDGMAAGGSAAAPPAPITTLSFTVRAMDGKSHGFSGVDSRTSVREIHRRLQQALGVPAWQQRLLHGSETPLGRNLTIAEAGIQDGADVILVLDDSLSRWNSQTQLWENIPETLEGLQADIARLTPIRSEQCSAFAGRHGGAYNTDRMKYIGENYGTGIQLGAHLKDLEARVARMLVAEHRK